MGVCAKCTLFVALIAILLSVAPLLYQQFDQRPYNARTTAEEAAQPNTFAGKTVIVTGASDGIGVATAKVLYDNGASVIMACRNLTKAGVVQQSILSEVSNRNEQNLDLMLLDLSSLQSVQQFVDSFLAKYSTLNILINNAGVMGMDEYTLSADGVEKQFATNNLGHWYLTQQLTPLLIKSAKSSASISRVINTASVGYLFAPFGIESWVASRHKLDDPNAYSPMGQYGLTKALNIVTAKEYNRRYHKQGVYAVSLHPGSIKSGLQKYNKYMRWFNDNVPCDLGNLPGVKTTSQGAATQIRCAAMTDEEFKQSGGQYFEDSNVASMWRSDLINDKLGALFWNLCTSIVTEKGFTVYA